MGCKQRVEDCGRESASRSSEGRRGRGEGYRGSLGGHMRSSGGLKGSSERAAAIRGFRV